jgi:hypothetical protein
MVCCWPNKSGDITAGICLKLTGDNSFEYFKHNPDEFEEFLFKSCPDAKGIFPIDLSMFDDSYKTRLINM